MAATAEPDAKSLLAKATAFRWLAREILPGTFQSDLLAMASDCERQAAKREGWATASGGIDDMRCE